MDHYLIVWHEAVVKDIKKLKLTKCSIEELMDNVIEENKIALEELAK